VPKVQPAVLDMSICLRFVIYVIDTVVSTSNLIRQAAFLER